MSVRCCSCLRYRDKMNKDLQESRLVVDMGMRRVGEEGLESGANRFV
jgi:hypothetical protein